MSAPDQNVTQFLPVDISSAVNTGPSFPPGPGNWETSGFPVGQQRFWGVQFALPEPPQNRGMCWIAISGDPVSRLPACIALPLPTPVTAGGVLVAHCTDIENASAQVGAWLATYTLIYADGDRARHQVRRRFEIAARRPALGTQGFATVSHSEPRPVRDPGPGQDGLYGLSSAGASDTFWLCWLANPRPDEPLMAIELAAQQSDLVVIGGLTLTLANSNPLRRSPRTSVRIDLPGPEVTSGYTTAGSNTAVCGDVSVGVSIGQVVRVAEARDLTPVGWHEGLGRGWGEMPGHAPPRAVIAEVYAAEVADLLVSRGARTWTIPWRAVLAGGAESDDGRVRIRLAHPQRARLRVVVVDADTRQMIAVRVNFCGPSGEYLPPRGHTPDVNPNWGEDIGGDLRLGATNYAYVPGQFEIDVPVGPIYVEIVRGFEYTPLRATYDIALGQTDLRLELRRWSDARQRGYYSGDVHVHFVDPATAALEAAAEDLNVTNLLAVQWGRSFTNVEHGIGSLAPYSTAENLIRVDSENRHHIMGHLFLLGLTEPVLPLSSGGPTEDELGGWEEVMLADWCDACHAQGGLVCTQFMPTPHAEVVADIVLGKIDATEVRWFEFTGHVPLGGHWGETPFDFPGIGQWYRYLNCGYRLPAIGGTDKMSNTTAVGALRTYAHLEAGQTFSYSAWSRALKAGRTFASSGPLMELNLQGCEPGDEIQLPDGGGPLAVTASAHSAQRIEFIEIVQNGQVVARAAAEADGLSAHVSARLPVTESSWLAARCYGREKIWTRWPIDIGAHTSAIYVVVGGQRQTSTLDASYLLTLLEGGMAYVNTLASFRSEAQRQRYHDLFLAGREAIWLHHPNARPNWNTDGGNPA